MESVISIRKLGLSFERDGRRTEVLAGLDLEIARGSFVAIVGASGVGKSTLLRVLIGLVSASAGSAVVRPAASGHPPAALVFQDSRLLPWRHVVDNVSFGLEGRGLSRRERHARALAALETVELASLAQRWPHQLSGGQRQRVSLARALAVEPDVLLMDEPFSALDALTRENLQDELIRIWRITGKTILFVTHDIDEALYLADRVIVLAGAPGRVVADLALDAPRPRQRGEAQGESLETIRRLLGTVPARGPAGLPADA